MKNRHFDQRESSRDQTIVSDPILSQYGVTYDRLIPGLWRGQNVYFSSYTAIVLFFLLLPCFLFATRIVHLEPPVINEETIVSKIVCARPYRNGFAKISIEQNNGKTIVHCYGHGGNGWQTLFGTVEKAISLYQGEKNTPIRVIGAGCIGLTMAAELHRNGFPVSGITYSECFDICSWRAAGYFSIPEFQSATTEENQMIRDYAIRSYEIYKEIIEGKHPYFKKANLSSYPVYCTDKTEKGMKKMSELGIIAPGEDVTLNFNGILRTGFREYHPYFIHVCSMMNDLHTYLKEEKIPLQQKKIHTFDEVEEEVIFNCTGLGASELTQDPNLKPIWGHLIMIDDQIPHEYMIYFLDHENEYVYLYPKTSFVCEQNPAGVKTTAVLGGTFVESCSSEDFAKILSRHIKFFYQK